MEIYLKEHFTMKNKVKGFLFSLMETNSKDLLLTEKWIKELFIRKMVVSSGEIFNLENFLKENLNQSQDRAFKANSLMDLQLKENILIKKEDKSKQFFSMDNQFKKEWRETENIYSLSPKNMNNFSILKDIKNKGLLSKDYSEINV